MKLLLLLSLVALACAKGIPRFAFVEEWQLWKSAHSKQYVNQKEELERHLVWLSNREYILGHNANADVFGFTLKMNHFGDMTDTEFMEKYGNYQSVKNPDAKEFKPPQFENGYPDSIDWRTKGAVTDVKNQGDCGAAYAFSAIGAIEGAWGLAHGKTVLSEQNIVDCSVSYGNHGCQGGNMYNSFLYVLANEGVSTQDKYPFYGRQGQCKYNKKDPGAKISGSVSISSGNEANLQAAVASSGPVAVAVDGSNKAFRYYDSGVYNLPGCSSYDLNTALLVIGYGTNKGADYWLLKNSWGTNWGMSGYIMMTRNQYNQCGIATDASFPTL